MAGQQIDRWSARSLAIIATCGLGNILGVTTMLNATFSNFLVPVSEGLGWPRSQFSFVLTLVSVIGIVAYPLSGRLIDRFGARPIALVGNILFGLSLASLSLMPSDRRWVYLMFCLLGIAAALPSTVLFAQVVSTWFTRRRGVVLGLSGGVAFGIGGTLISITAQALIVAIGWRGAYAALGALVIVIGLPVFALLLREGPIGQTGVTPSSPSDGLTRSEAIRTPAFWLLLVSVSLGAGSISAIITHIVPIALETGNTAGTGLAALAALYAANAGWQIVLGLILDRTASPRLAAIFVLPGIAGAVLLGASGDPTVSIIAGLLVGLSCGTEYGLLPFCIPRYFGFRSYGEVYGMIFGAIMLVQGLAPYVMDLVFEATGSYRPALAMIAIALAGCAALIAALPRLVPDQPTAGPIDLPREAFEPV